MSIGSYIVLFVWQNSGGGKVGDWNKSMLVVAESGSGVVKFPNGPVVFR